MSLPIYSMIIKSPKNIHFIRTNIFYLLSSILDMIVNIFCMYKKGNSNIFSNKNTIRMKIRMKLYDSSTKN